MAKPSWPLLPTVWMAVAERCGSAAEVGEEPADALGVGVGGVGVDDVAVADDVVGEDEGAGAGELEGRGEVFRVAGFVGVDEDEVEGRGVLGVELGEGRECGAEAELDGVGEAGVGDVGEGYLGVLGVEFEGDELAAGWERAGEADGAVAAEGSDLEDAVGALGFGEELEELALVGRDVDGGQVRRRCWPLARLRARGRSDEGFR